DAAHHDELEDAEYEQESEVVRVHRQHAPQGQPEPDHRGAEAPADEADPEPPPSVLLALAAARRLPPAQPAPHDVGEREDMRPGGDLPDRPRLQAVRDAMPHRIDHARVD